MIWVYSIIVKIVTIVRCVLNDHSHCVIYFSGWPLSCYIGTCNDILLGGVFFGKLAAMTNFDDVNIIDL